MNMVFDLKKLQVDILKKFDGKYNYFNPSHFNGKTIFRREHKYEDKLLVSDTVDDQDNIILQHYIDDNYLWSYEDARFINENEISVCCCKRDKNDLVKVINVEYKKYNLTTKEFTHFKTQNTHFEKHWQFYNDKIIYHINPYTIFDSDENIIYKRYINLEPWIEKYGTPGLSTNIFEVNGIKYLLFHSYKTNNNIVLKYNTGILRLDDNLNPIAYGINTLFNSYECDSVFINEYFNWKRKLIQLPTIVDVIFPMNVIVDDNNLNIYAGVNDYSAVNIKINKDYFINKIKNEPFILV